MPRRYTAQEMRDLAESEDFAAYLYDDPKRCPDPDFAEDDATQMVRDMLRQAADMMERAEGLIAALEYRHKDADVVLAAANYITKGVRP